MVTFMLCKYRKRQIEEITLQKIPFQVTGEAGNLQIRALHKNAVEEGGFLLTLPLLKKKNKHHCLLLYINLFSLLVFSFPPTLSPGSAIRDEPVTGGHSLAEASSHSSIGSSGAGTICAGWKMVPRGWSLTQRGFYQQHWDFCLVFCGDRGRL